MEQWIQKQYDTRNIVQRMNVANSVISKGGIPERGIPFDIELLEGYILHLQISKKYEMAFEYDFQARN